MLFSLIEKLDLHVKVWIVAVRVCIGRSINFSTNNLPVTMKHEDKQVPELIVVY